MAMLALGTSSARSNQRDRLRCIQKAGRGSTHGDERSISTGTPDQRQGIWSKASSGPSESVTHGAARQAVGLQKPLMPRERLHFILLLPGPIGDIFNRKAGSKKHLSKINLASDTQRFTEPELEAFLKAI